MVHPARLLALDLLHQRADRHRGHDRHRHRAARADQQGLSHKIDWWGTTFLSAGVVALILLTTWGGTTYAWGSTMILSLGIGGAALLVIFCLVELRASEPIIPLVLFRNRTFSAASAVGFVIGFTMFGAIVYLPLYLQIVHGASPTKSGLELLPLVGGMLVTFILSGQLVTRTGRYKAFPIAGSAVVGRRIGLPGRSRAHDVVWHSGH
jgi:predicted MFS family arabinose efflux permease